MIQTIISNVVDNKYSTITGILLCLTGIGLKIWGGIEDLTLLELLGAGLVLIFGVKDPQKK